jgi:hypothetical protein
MGKFKKNELDLLNERVGETNPNNLVLIQLKEKAPEVYVGKA